MKILTILISAALLSTAHAERFARVMYYGAPADAPKIAFVHQVGEIAQEIELDPHNFSGSIKVAADASRLVFLPAPLAEGVEIPKSAPFVKIPKSWKKVLILVSKDPSNSVMPVRFMPINASDDVFGPGEVFLVNFSEMTIFGYVGSKKLLSKPMSTELIAHPAEENGLYLVKLAAFKDDPKKVRNLVQQNCIYDPKVRVLTLALPLPPPRMVQLYSAPIGEFEVEDSR